MARSRNIKPGFFRNAELVELPFETRLLFPGLWMLADREGRLEDRPKQIKMEIFPADSLDVDAMLQQLHSANLIVRYEVEGKRFIQIITFSKHQQPHHREPPSVIPECPGITESSPGQDQGKEEARNGKAALNPDVLNPDVLNPDVLNPDVLNPDVLNPELLGGDESPQPNAQRKTSGTPKRATSMPDDFAATPEHQALAKQLGVSLEAEFPAFTDFHRAKGSVFKDWNAALRTWLRNAQKFGKLPGQLPGFRPPSDRWRSSNEGIERKGKEVGLMARPGESYNDYARRIEDVLRRRNAEGGMLQ